jgi:hypothetical protein
LGFWACGFLGKCIKKYNSKSAIWRAILDLRGAMKKLFFIILTAVSANALAASQSCLQKYAAYVDARVLWQNQSTSLAVKMLPHYKELADHYNLVQLSSMHLMNLAVQLTLQKLPSEIDTSAKLNQWIELSPGLEAKLSQISTDYKSALDKHKNLMASAPNKNGDEFRKAFRDEVVQSKEFQVLLSEFGANIAKIELIECANK